MVSGLRVINFGSHWVKMHIKIGRKTAKDWQCHLGNVYKTLLAVFEEILPSQHSRDATATASDRLSVSWSANNSPFTVRLCRVCRLRVRRAKSLLKQEINALTNTQQFPPFSRRPCRIAEARLTDWTMDDERWLLVTSLVVVAAVKVS